MDDVIRFAPAHFEEVLGSFGSDGAQAADEDDVLGLKLREQDGKKVAERVVEEDVENKAHNRWCPLQEISHKSRYYDNWSCCGLKQT